MKTEDLENKLISAMLYFRNIILRILYAADVAKIYRPIRPIMNIPLSEMIQALKRLGLFGHIVGYEGDCRPGSCQGLASNDNRHNLPHKLIFVGSRIPHFLNWRVYR